jgi:hypothetical protein
LPFSCTFSAVVIILVLPLRVSEVALFLAF